MCTVAAYFWITTELKRYSNRCLHHCHLGSAAEWIRSKYRKALGIIGRYYDMLMCC